MNNIKEIIKKEKNIVVKLEILRDWIKKENQKLDPLSNDADITLHRELQFKISYLRGLIVQAHGKEMYKKVTQNFEKNYRVGELLEMLSKAFPCLIPSKNQLDADNKVKLSMKKGYELSYGTIISELLNIPEVAYHIMESMQLPLEESHFYKDQFFREGIIEFQTVRLERVGNIGFLTFTNIDCLNAEDFTTMHETELATDLILLDPKIDIGVIRGDVMRHKKYKDKRAFSSGVNLTKLYNGELPYLFYVDRELGFMNKIYRGLVTSDGMIDDIEKPWIGVVDTFAIGGGCQIMLICDYVLAAKDAYFTIPARIEGFIPGLANLRLQRYTGQTLANRMINLNHKVEANTTEGSLLVDEVKPTEDIDKTIHKVVRDISHTGMQGMISNRKAFRIGIEPLETFRNYMALYTKQQALCMYDKEIIKNLEKFWGVKLNALQTQA